MKEDGSVGPWRKFATLGPGAVADGLKVAREADGFHGLETLFCLVSLADELRAERRDGRGVTVDVEGADVGPAEDNLAVRGESTRVGSAATPDTPAAQDHVTVARLRAGGVPLGRLPFSAQVVAVANGLGVRDEIRALDEQAPPGELDGAVVQPLDHAARRLALVEAVPEIWDLKVSSLRGVEEHLDADAFLASNTSSLSVSGLAKELKRRGFRFVGPTTAYALMQATGMVNDHLASCAFR